MNYAIDQIGLAMAYSFVDMAIIGALTWIALGVTKNFAPAVRYWIALAGLAVVVDTVERHVEAVGAPAVVTGVPARPA